MIIGIVGSEAAKFTPETEARAREQIRLCLHALAARGGDQGTGDHQRRTGDTVVSGACHLGGIDVWAIEEATALGLFTKEFPPKDHRWRTGYRPRNMQIAWLSQRVICITVRTLPPNYTGMRFKGCYHCDTDTHVKSGGCWTVKFARRLKKPAQVFVIE